MAVIETEVKNIKKSIDDHVINERKDFDLVFKKLDKLNGKFAGKWVESITIGILITTIAGIILFTITKLGG